MSEPIKEDSKPIRKLRIIETIATWCTIILVTIFGLKFALKNTAYDNDDFNKRVRPNDNIFTAKGLVEQGDFDEAVARLNAILKKQPNYGEANLLLGYIYMQQDENQKALDCYKIAAKYHPDLGTIKSAIEILDAKLEGEQN